MNTTVEQALYLLQLINNEIASSADNILPLYDMRQLCIDYIHLLDDIELERTAQIQAKRMS